MRTQQHYTQLRSGVRNVQCSTQADLVWASRSAGDTHATRNDCFQRISVQHGEICFKRLQRAAVPYPGHRQSTVTSLRRLLQRKPRLDNSTMSASTWNMHRHMSVPK